MVESTVTSSGSSGGCNTEGRAFTLVTFDAGDNLAKTTKDYSPGLTMNDKAYYHEAVDDDIPSPIQPPFFHLLNLLEDTTSALLGTMGHNGMGMATS